MNVIVLSILLEAVTYMYVYDTFPCSTVYIFINFITVKYDLEFDGIFKILGILEVLVIEEPIRLSIRHTICKKYFVIILITHSETRIVKCSPIRKYRSIGLIDFSFFLWIIKKLNLQ